MFTDEYYDPDHCPPEAESVRVETHVSSDPAEFKLDKQDTLILHALGVTFEETLEESEYSQKTLDEVDREKKLGKLSGELP